jgi:hypothetical protein
VRALVLALLLTACGARTGLRTEPRDAAVDAATPIDAPAMRDAASFTDAVLPCHSDAECDDHLYCDGRETCSIAGCVAGTTPCDDGVDCTDDACIETNAACTHAPNDAHCPLSNVCDPIRGCLPRLLAQDPTSIYNIELPSGRVTRITRTQVPLTDVALAEDGTFYGATSTLGLVRLDPHTGATTMIVPISGAFYGLEADPTTDALYGGADQNIVRFDLTNGSYTPVGRLPPNEMVSGDLAFIGGRMLVTTTTNFRVAPDDLYAVPLDRSGPPVLIGNTGYACIFGLAVYRDTLYGLTCNGQVLTIDPATAASQVVSTTSIEFDGGAAR